MVKHLHLLVLCRDLHVVRWGWGRGACGPSLNFSDKNFLVEHTTQKENYFEIIHWVLVFWFRYFGIMMDDPVHLVQRLTC